MCAPRANRQSVTWRHGPRRRSSSRAESRSTIWASETIEEIEASQGERRALASRLGLVSLDRLVARVSLRRLPRGGPIRAEASLSATVTQACVVTLAPVTSEVEHEFGQLFDTSGGSEPCDEIRRINACLEPHQPLLDAFGYALLD